MDAIGPVAEIITLLWDPIARRVKYFTKIEENIENLEKQVNELKDERDDLKRDVRQKRCEGKVPPNVVEHWQKNADEIIKNAEEILSKKKDAEEILPKKKDAEEMQEEFQGNKKCFYGWCLDCPSRYKLGMRIVKETQKAQKHIEKKKDLGESLWQLEHQQKLPTATIREGTSTWGTLDLVWNWLMDAETRKIGIWGKGGVGKTTLVKNINNKLKYEKTQHFEVVILVTVSRDWNIKKLRNDIGKEIDPNFSAEEDETRASKSLFNRLNGENFLLILDDMWEKVDLDKLGVPTPENNSGCKIVITTRNKDVCNRMETDKEIMVESLSEEEAWKLFQEKAGNEISSDIARDVCKECHGLPLAIIVVGPALRKETDPKVWEYARGMLKNSEFKLEGMEREVYLPLKFSYDHLQTDLRNCFLYCSLFPEDYEIDVDDLIKYWIMEGFIQRDKNLEEASLEGHYLLKQLIDSCLLEKVEGGEPAAVRMHDVIRDMAIKITSESREIGRRFLVQAGVGLEECPKVEQWEGKDRISLMENNIRFLPDEPKCSELSTLLLQSNELLEEIPLSFFSQMENLRGLDLSGSYVVSLPPSISKLGSLQALILRGCRILKRVTHVGGL